MQELMQDVDKSQVTGISFAGQMHGLVILDEKDEVIRPCILWNDGRTIEFAIFEVKTIYHEKKIFICILCQNS